MAVAESAEATRGDGGRDGLLGSRVGWGVAAVALAAVNIFGGFLVTRRMLEMFKKKDKKAVKKSKKQKVNKNK